MKIVNHKGEVEDLSQNGMYIIHQKILKRYGSWEEAHKQLDGKSAKKETSKPEPSESDDDAGR